MATETTETKLELLVDFLKKLNELQDIRDEKKNGGNPVEMKTTPLDSEEMETKIELLNELLKGMNELQEIRKEKIEN